MKPLPTTPKNVDSTKAEEFDQLKRRIHNKLVDKLDLSRIGDLQGDVLRREIRLVVEHLCDTEETFLNRNERERLIEEVLDETFGFGPLELLLKDPLISDCLGKYGNVGAARRFTAHPVDVVAGVPQRSDGNAREILVG